MNDDVGRRVRDALRSAPLPDAPDTLRAAVSDIAATPPPDSRWSGRQQILSVLAVAAAVVLVVAGIGGLGRITAPGQATPGTTTGPMDRTPGPAATPGPSVVAAPPSSVHVLTADELEALLAADRSAWVGKPVLVAGHLAPGTEKTVCIPCDLGTLAGTTERVFATDYTASLLPPGTDASPNGVMAFTVRADGLEYLGRMGYLNGVDFTATPADLKDSSSMPRGPVTFIVRGWLVEEGPIPCPAPPSPFPPQDTPFVTCPDAWLTLDEVQPVHSAPTSITVSEPANAIRVQWGAYDTFAPNPVRTADGSATQPCFGTYLVRLVTNTAIGRNGPRGWQVVGRLDP